MLNAPIVFPHPQYGSSISGQNNLPFQLSSVMRKPFFWASDQVRHNQGCTATEAGLKVPFRKKRECTYYAAKPKAMISCGITGQLICAFIFVYTYTKRRFSHKVGGRTGLMVRASDSRSGDPGSILGRVGVFVSLSKRH